MDESPPFRPAVTAGSPKQRVTSLQQGSPTASQVQDPSLSSSSSSTPLTTLAGDEDLPWVDLEFCLRAAGYERLLDSWNLSCLWTASMIPPITKEGMQQLDYSEMIRCVSLRHDLNFNSNICLRRSTFGTHTRFETQRSDDYWEALKIELTLYTLYCEGVSVEGIASDKDTRSCFPAPESFTGLPLRLPRLIRDIRHIVLSLVSPSKHAAVHARLDTKLLMQALDHGQLDIVSIIEWVGLLLIDVCSPSRDTLIDSMICGASLCNPTGDAQDLCLLLEELFSIMEIIKLDAANHVLRFLRTSLLSDCITFERTRLLESLESGWSVPNWLTDPLFGCQGLAVNDFQTFICGFHAMLVFHVPEPPLAFLLDKSRVRGLQADFRSLVFQAACCHALDITLQQLRVERPPPQTSHRRMLRRLNALQRNAMPDPDEQRDANVLEITREAIRIGHIDSFPAPRLLQLTAETLQQATDPSSNLSCEIQRSVADRFLGLLDAECKIMNGLDAVQMAARTAIHNMEYSDMWRPISDQNIAARAAHVAVLHWKVWAPVLYLAPATKANVVSMGRRPHPPPSQIV